MKIPNIITGAPDQTASPAGRVRNRSVRNIPMPKLRDWPGQQLRKALEFCIPKRCGLCQDQTEAGFCSNCQSLLPWIKHGCRQCGTALASGFICGQCQNRNFGWQEAIIPFHYVDPISSLIHGLKYSEKLSLVSALSSMLALTVIKRCAVLPDVLVPVPLHTVSLRKRGYNQSALIAKELGLLLGIPVREDLIIKSRQTESQTRLNLTARKANVDRAFSVVKSNPGISIAVVDDVITSGATMREVCQSLRNNRYDQISVWAIAKTNSV